MEIGVSTATFFGRQSNEDALVTLNELGVEVCEIFLESFSEYSVNYCKLLKSRLGGLRVNSVHTMNTHYEPQLFSHNERARNDGEYIFRKVLYAASMLGCENYTMHGRARIKKNVNYECYEADGKNFDRLSHIAEEYGISLCLENVEWASCANPAYFSGASKGAKTLRACFDVKQARISGYDYKEYLSAMKGRINTVHLSDVSLSGEICLPGRGCLDFYELFSELKKADFRGNMLIEVYKESFSDVKEIKDSIIYLRKIKEEVFGK